MSTYRIIAQNDKPISDFYEFVNKEWLESTVLPENSIVINQVGILWEKIEKTSVEILTDKSTYDLDEDHLYALNQLRYFYKSTSEVSENERKRLSEVHKRFPMVFGIIFSKITITPEKEERVREIIKYLIQANRSKITNSNKIGKYYKDLFLAKLDNMKFNIGSPSLSSLPKIPKLSGKSYDDIIRLVEKYELEKEQNKIDWHTPPYETDCFYFSNYNQINIYAGFLLDFNEEDDMVYLFATLGRTIAHEMTHAFDNVGKDFDQNGKRINGLKKLFSGGLFSQNDWEDMYQELIHQYGQYSIHDSLFVDGEKTLQENIADLGGVEVSFMALKLFLAEKHLNYAAEEQTEYLQQYFIYYTRYWKEKGTAEFEIYSVKRIHTPQKFRAIGPVYNQDEFYELFKIAIESEYYIPVAERITIW